MKSAGSTTGMLALLMAVMDLWAGMGAARAEDTLATRIRRKLDDPQGGVFVVAHRGCHNPSPAQHMRSVPENSLPALEQCVQLGVDMMETDVRRSKDGALIIIHDSTVDRTTDGTGRVADLTLSELKRLRLRQNFGGRMSPMLGEERVLTLDELLAAAKGRIMLNLDIKEHAIYPQVTETAIRAGMTQQILIKSEVRAVASPQADEAPYNLVPYIPIITGDGVSAPEPLGAITASQVAARHRPPAIEMVYLDEQQFEAVRAVANRAGVRLWANTLTGVGVLSIVTLGGDIDALRDASTWGTLISAGISVIQTDEPGSLLDYLRRTSSSPAAGH
jgi:glycerophosphoryl diester phosphodiesterase